MLNEKSVLGSAFALLAFTGWARAGVYSPWHTPIWGLFVLMLTLLVFFGFKKRGKAGQRDAGGGQHGSHPSSKGIRSLLKDPLLYIGLLLNLILLSQWLNVGSTLYHNTETGIYFYSEPPVVWLPFSLDGPYAARLLLWFFPVWVLLLMVRHLFTAQHIKLLTWALVWNAAALAVVGLVQYGLGWQKMFGLFDFEVSHMIASFAYPNHGGAFFGLLYAFSIGLLIDALEKKKRVRQIAVPAALALLFGATTLASLSRGAIAGALGITVIGLVVWIVLHREKIKSSGWLNIGLFCGVMVVLFISGLVGIGDGAPVHEFKGPVKTGEEKRLNERYWEDRGYQIPPAIEMLKDYPWFGVGAFGYRKYMRVVLPEEEFQHYLKYGCANVHCDPVQFLAEHGGVGFGLMTAGVAVLLWSWRKFKRWRFKGLALMTLCGTGAVCMQSLVDVPFRCPAVLWHWLLLLAIVPALAGRSLRSVSE